MNYVRPFPIRVQAFVGESPESYFRRICAANVVSERDAWLMLRHQDPNLGYKVATELGAHHVAALGGLPGSHFDAATGRSGGRGHPLLAFPTGAVRGEPLPSTVLCRRCTQGEDAVARAWFGPICLRHRRWVQPEGSRALGRDVDTRRLPHHNSAQRCLNGTLRARGIGYSSLAVNAAREALRRVKREQFPRSKDEVIPLDVEMAEFPDVVRLTAHLTSPAMVRVLLDDELAAAERGIAISYVTHVLLAGRDVAEAIARIHITGREITLGRDSHTIGPYTRVNELPDFAMAIPASNGGIRTRLLRFLQTSESRRQFAPRARTPIGGAVGSGVRNG